MAAASSDGTCSVWKFDENDNPPEYGATLRGGSLPITRMCWDPVNDGRLVTASQDGTIRIWDVKSKFTLIYYHFETCLYIYVYIYLFTS